MQSVNIKTSLPSHKIALISLAVSCGLIPLTVYARDNSRIGIDQHFVVDTFSGESNIRDETIYGSETGLYLILDRETPKSNFITNARVSRNQFNDPDYNSTDYSLKSNYKTNTDRWTVGFGGNIAYDTTRDEVDTDLGIFTDTSRRLDWSLGPNIQYKVSPTTNFSVNTKWMERRYEAVNLSDYRVITTDPTLSYDFTQLQQISASVRYRLYESLENNQSVESIGPYLGWQYNFQPNYSLSLYAGALASDFNGYNGVNNGTEINPIYSARLSYSGERNNASIGVTRSREAYPNGTEYDLTTANVENLFTINPLWSLTAGVSYKTTEQKNLAASDLGRAWQESFGLYYNPTNRWGVSLSQQFRYEELESGQNTNRNIVKLNLSYSFGGIEESIRN